MVSHNHDPVIIITQGEHLSINWHPFFIIANVTQTSRIQSSLAVNVAYGKPSDQSSTIRGGDSRNANDGNTNTVHENRYCTETKNENSPWWQVDLLQPYEIRVVRIITRGCCGHQPLHDLEIRVGNSSVVQGNKLCAWYPGTLGKQHGWCLS